MGKVQLFMKKTPQPMSILDARKNMGCAVRTEEDTLVVATFGAAKGTF